MLRRFIVISIIALPLFAGEMKIPPLNTLVPYQWEKLPDTSKTIHHPLIKLLDENGQPVIKTGKPVSTRKTCGKCHDYDFITHSYHFQQGHDEYDENWGVKNKEPGSYSPGMYGRQYDYPYYHLTPLDWKKRGVPFEYGSPNWALQCGICHLGGGPTEFDRRGRRYDKVPDSKIAKMDPDYYWWNRKADKFLKWDWKRSGVREANCLVCHTPNYSKGIQDMRTTGKGIYKYPHFSSSTSAGLITTGIVKKVLDNGKVIYNPKAFYPDGTLRPGWLKISGEFARANACLQCHAAPVINHHVDPWYNTPVVRTINRGVLRKGFVWSKENISECTDNIVGKDTMNYPWDVHAKAGLTCIDCHQLPNSPGIVKQGVKGYQDTTWSRLAFAEFIKRPDHNFGKGNPLTWRVRDDMNFTVKRCEDCHDAMKKGHDWLPQKELHLKKIACTTCHVPKIHYWSINSFNFALPRPEPFSLGVKITGACGEAPQWFTLLGTKGNPIENPKAKIDGFYPLYIPNNFTPNGPKQIAPYAVTFSLHWIDKATGERLYFRQILNAFFKREGTVWVPKKEVLKVFDANHNGKIDQQEALFDTDAKVELGKKLLKQVGVKDPELEIVAMPFSLVHNVAPKSKAIKDCNECHTANSRIFNRGKYSRIVFNAPVKYSDSRIYNVRFLGIPVLKTENGKVYWDNWNLLKDYHLIGAIKPEETASKTVKIVELIGQLIVILTIIGVILHALGRIILRGASK